MTAAGHVPIAVQSISLSTGSRIQSVRSDVTQKSRPFRLVMATTSFAWPTRRHAVPAPMPAKGRYMRSFAEVAPNSPS